MPSGASPWWLAPGRVDWERAGRLVDFCRASNAFGMKWASVEGAVEAPWLKLAAWTAALSAAWSAAAMAGAQPAWWMLPIAALAPLVGGLCAVECARVVLEFAARGAKSMLGREVVSWGEWMRGSAPGGSIDEAFRRAGSSGAIARHALGMALREALPARRLDEPAQEALGRSEPLWMGARMAAYRLVEPLTRATAAGRRAELSRLRAARELEGAYGQAVGSELFPWESALNERGEIGAASAQAAAPSAPRRARL